MSWPCSWDGGDRELIHNFGGKISLQRDEIGDGRMTVRWILGKLVVRLGGG